jgi:phospho-N-acetylmuramoyl-pentapeptide-transferase
MNLPNLLPLALGLMLFSFLVTSIVIVPFINLLYKLNLTRRKEAPKSGKVPVFDKYHDIKAGTPVGGGILIILVVTALFSFLVPFASHMGISIRSFFNFNWEVFVIFFTFISFGLLGLSDDLMKMFFKPRPGLMGLWFGMSRRSKFFLQWLLAIIISLVLYYKLGIQIIHIPFFNINLNLGFWYVIFSSFVIVSFANAFNITDGLDGLSVGLFLICLTTFGIISSTSLDTPLSLFIALLIGSLFAFLYFNVWPARIFLGDTGALSFGATLAVIGLLTGSIVALVIVGGVFIVEISSSLIQMVGWKFLHKPVFPIAPLHHSFLVWGWEEPKIVFRAWLVGLILALFALWLSVI